MHGTNNNNSLSGKVLIATPSLNESIFERSLIFICAHDGDGAAGVIFNKPNAIITNKGIYDAFDLKRRFKVNKKYTIYTGGPAESEKLFILSASKEQETNFVKVPELTLYTNAEGFLLDVINSKNQDKFLICKGFCGWSAGQLEQEINENSWIVTDVDFKTIFAGKPAPKWEKLIKKVGIKNPDRLVSYSGHA